MKTDVIIIDSGVNNCLKDKIIGGINLSGIGDENEIDDNIGHGSSVLNLILSHKPDASIYMIKVCDDYKGFSFDHLCEALEYIIRSGIRCKLLNISLGITRLDNFSRLHNLIVSVKEKTGAVIVAAYQNYGLISYPAGFEEVIGVDSSPSCSKRNEFEYVENSIVNVRASSAYFHAFDENGKKLLIKGNSFATANLTGLMLQKADNYPGEQYYDRCLNYLKCEAKAVYGSTGRVATQENAETNLKLCSVQKWSPTEFFNRKTRAVIFPFNKEMHSIARFEAMLSIEVVGYYDHRISINNYKRVDDVIRCQLNDKIIKPIDELEWGSDFDLMVCGHCGEVEALTGDDILSSIISKCTQYGKKLYCFDDPTDVIKKVSDIDTDNIFFPYVDKSMVKPYRFDKLRKSSKPVVGVYGTSSRQGKHTLQLYLRKELMKKGFKVGQLGTEPHGYLFGLDYVYPMGYNSSVYVDRYDAIRVLNEAMWEIECKDPDIIITGCQSGTVPYNINHLSNINFATYEFFIGTSPDAVILCVNAFDSIEYIQKTIKFLEGVGNAKVIALVVFPVIRDIADFNIKDRSVDSKDLERIREVLCKRIGINTYVNKEDYVGAVTNEILNYFSD